MAPWPRLLLVAGAAAASPVHRRIARVMRREGLAGAAPRPALAEEAAPGAPGTQTQAGGGPAILVWVQDACGGLLGDASGSFTDVKEPVASVQCCADDRAGATRCVRSIGERCLSEIHLSNGSSLVSFHRAREICQHHGLRLCKRSEPSLAAGAGCCGKGCGLDGRSAWTSTVSPETVPVLNMRLQDWARHLQHEQLVARESARLEAERVRMWKGRLAGVDWPPKDAAALQVLSDHQVKEMLRARAALQREYSAANAENRDLRHRLHRVVQFSQDHRVVRPEWQSATPAYAPRRPPPSAEWARSADTAWVAKYPAYLDAAAARARPTSEDRRPADHEFGSRRAAFYPSLGALPPHPDTQQPRLWEPAGPRDPDGG